MSVFDFETSRFHLCHKRSFKNSTIVLKPRDLEVSKSKADKSYRNRSEFPAITHAYGSVVSGVGGSGSDLMFRFERSGFRIQGRGLPLRELRMVALMVVQGYLPHKKPRPRRTLQ